MEEFKNLIINQHLTIEAFSQWLTSQDADAVVGEAGRATCCPVANYLFVKTGGVRTVHVLEDDEMLNFGATLDEPAIYMPAPIWVQSFAGHIDGSRADTGDYRDYRVTAAQALKALNAVRAGME